MDLQPISSRPLPNNVVHITQRQYNLSGTPLPEDMRAVITDHFNLSNATAEDLEIVYQYILSKSNSGEIDDIKSTLQALADKLQPNNDEMFRKIRDLAINEIKFTDPEEHIDIKKDIIEKEIPSLERQAQETGDWRYYLRASHKKEKLDEISSLGR